MKYENTNVPLIFYKKMYFKSLWTNQNEGSFKLQYLTHELRYEFELSYVSRHLQKKQIHLIILCECSQV